jgi:hypothetical protein
MVGGRRELPKLAVLRSRITQAVARPSEVDEWRETTAEAGSSTRRSAAVCRSVGQLAISERHNYDF